MQSPPAPPAHAIFALTISPIGPFPVAAERATTRDVQETFDLEFLTPNITYRLPTTATVTTPRQLLPNPRDDVLPWSAETRPWRRQPAAPVGDRASSPERETHPQPDPGRRDTPPQFPRASRAPSPQQSPSCRYQQQQARSARSATLTPTTERLPTSTSSCGVAAGTSVRSKRTAPWSSRRRAPRARSSSCPWAPTPSATSRTTLTTSFHKQPTRGCCLRRWCGR